MRFKGLSIILVSSLLVGCFGSNQLTLKDMKSRDIIVDVTTPVDVDRQEAIKYYRSLLEFDIDNRYRLRAMRRLADLELEAGEQREIVDRAVLSAGEIGEYERSVQTYRDLLATYPNYEGNDVVLYQLARAYERLVMMDESMEALTQLVDRYPSSSLYDEVQFRRGEMYFIEGDFENSADAYQSVIQYGETSRFYFLSLHKHGWNLLKMDQFEGALDSFFSLLDMKLGTMILGDIPYTEFDVSANEQELINDTLYAISLVFSYLNDMDYVDEYISKRGRQNYDYAVYQTLAEFYVKQRRHQDATRVYNNFAVRYPEAPQAAFFKQRVIDLYIDAGNYPELVLTSKKHYVQVYGPNTPFWLNYRDEVKGRLKPNIKGHLGELTEYYHALAQKDKKPEYYKEAETWYWSYLKSFPDEPETPDFHYLLADLYFEQRKYDLAAAEYDKVAYTYPGYAKGQEAGYAAITSYSELLKRLPPEQRIVWRDKQIASVLKYSENYASDSRLARVQTSMAEESFNSGDYERAIMLARRVVEVKEGLDPNLAHSSWAVISHVEFENGNYAVAENAYTKLIEIGTQIRKVEQKHFEWLAASIYKQGEEKREEGNLQGAATDFLRIARVVPPGANVRITAEYDAAALFMEMGKWQNAIRIFEYFLANYRNHKLVIEVPLQLARAYNENGMTGKAADLYERVGTNQGFTAQVRQESLWEAAELYEKVGNVAGTIRAYESYAAEFEEPYDQLVEARHRLVQLYAKNNQPEKQDYMLKQLVLADEPTKATHTARSRYIVAQAALGLAERKMAEFRTIKLVEPLQKNLMAKKASMTDALDAYSQAAQYDVADVVTASTYRIGELYEQFSSELLESERPKDLNEEELEEYDIMLEEQAYPFEEKAISILESNAQRSADGYYDDWVKKSFDKLKSLVPARYSKTEKGAEIVYDLH